MRVSYSSSLCLQPCLQITKIKQTYISINKHTFTYKYLRKSYYQIIIIIFLNFINKFVTLATSRGLTMIADKNAAPAAEKALSPNPNFPSETFDVVSFDCDAANPPLSCLSSPTVNTVIVKSRPLISVFSGLIHGCSVASVSAASAISSKTLPGLLERKTKSKLL